MAVAVGWAAVAGWPWAAAGWAWWGCSSSCSINVLGGGGGHGAAGECSTSSGRAASRPPRTTARSSRTARPAQDANNKLECAVVADIDSIQAYWTAELPRLGHAYVPVPTVWFSGQVSTGCGAATSGSGPFYCPADKRVYIDLTFYDDLKTQFGADGGLFVDAYVLAHEYGHHVQDLLGIESKVKPGETGPTSGSVRLELQADCFAGVWAKHATEPGPNGEPALVASITQDDINRALDAAARIGDDYIQQNLGNGQVDQNAVHPRLVGAAAEVVQHRLSDGRPEPLRHVQRHRPRLMRRSGARGGSHPPVRKMLSDRRG